MIKEELTTRMLLCKSRTDLIILLMKFFDYTRYLEIGCRKNETFDLIKCQYKVGVDTEEGGTHRMTSDAFFEQNKEQFDFIFIDGDHHHDQVLRDFGNALLSLNTNGTIIMHDCSPPCAAYEGKRDYKCGTAWRAYAHMRQVPFLDAVVADWDYGCGLVRLGRNSNTIFTKKSMDEMTYADFEAHKTDWMRLSGRREIADWLWNQKQPNTPQV